MKGILTIILFTLGLQLGFSQQEIVATFIIKQAKHNEVNVSQSYTDDNAYLAFYTSDGDGELYMSNCRPIPNTQSFGLITNLETEEYEETQDHFSFQIYTFRWHFQNNYDSNSGSADVVLTKVFKPQGTTFTMEITTADLNVLEYKGIMGSGLNNNSTISEEEEATPINNDDNKIDRFREDYDLVTIYDPQTETWSDWSEGNNTFVMNYNKNGDIAHYKANGDVVTYRRISDVEIEYTETGKRYQIFDALDEDGILFHFQFFDDRSAGLKMIYNNMMIQFSSSAY